MFEKKDNLKKVIRNYIRELSKLIDIEKVYLYGSYAKRKYTQDSDIDLAIISKDAEDEKKLFKIMAQLSLTALKINPLIEAQFFSPEEFETYEPESFIAEVLRTGKMVYEKTEKDKTKNNVDIILEKSRQK